MSERWYDHWISVRSERVKTLQAWGVTERQARFLVHVLVFSRVFVERQYCQAVGIVHGQKSRDFIRRLIAQGYVTLVGVARRAKPSVRTASAPERPIVRARRRATSPTTLSATRSAAARACRASGARRLP
jgi:hypothetical protein